MLVTINYWPELTGIGKYTGEMAEWLIWDKGLSSIELTALVDYFNTKFGVMPF